jgi:hypothetical protein
MSSLVPRLRFEHQHPLRRPSCPWCGEPCLLAEWTEYQDANIRNQWQCDGCHHSFKTSADISPV